MKALIRQQLAAVLWANDPANTDPDELVEALLPIVTAAESRGRAERDEQTGAVIAALVARAELAEATTRRLVETLARIEYGPAS